MEGSVNIGRSERGLLDRLLGMVVEMDPTFLVIVKHPDKFGPILIVLLTVLASIPTTIYGYHTIPSVEGMPDVGRVYFVGVGLIGILIAQVALLFVRAGVFTLFSALLGNKASFKASFSVAGYLQFPSLIAVALGSLSVWIFDKPLSFSLGSVVSSVQQSSPLGVLLASVSVYSIWYIVLSMFALHHLWAVSKRKALAYTVIMWSVIVSVGMVAANFTS